MRVVCDLVHFARSRQTRNTDIAFMIGNAASVDAGILLQWGYRPVWHRPLSRSVAKVSHETEFRRKCGETCMLQSKQLFEFVSHLVPLRPF
jgi:hypothetical protein